MALAQLAQIDSVPLAAQFWTWNNSQSSKPQTNYKSLISKEKNEFPSCLSWRSGPYF
jgi:hypothetical protein